MKATRLIESQSQDYVWMRMLLEECMYNMAWGLVCVIGIK